MNSQYLSRMLYSYDQKSFEPTLQLAANNQLLLHYYRAYNGSGSAANVGIAVAQADDAFKIWAKGASTTEVTADIQAAVATQIVSTTNNHGFYVQCKSIFSLICMNVSQAAAGSPVYTYQYWNGSTWATLSTKEVPAYGSGYNYIVFIPPLYWEHGSDDGALDSSMYTIKVLATTAPSQAIEVDALKVGSFISWIDSLSSGQHLQIVFEGDRGVKLLQSQEYILPYFSVASSSNIVEAAYQVNP